MASNIIFFFSLTLVIAGAMMVSTPTAKAQISHPCKTTKDCEYLHCSSGTPLCVKRQCQCSVSVTRQAKIDNLITMSNEQTCKSTSDCDPHMKTTCVSGSYMCFNGFCTCI
ncbi:hypothetical protein EUTSA_v10005651mg [Eutrema salsugineum]|uniref:EB domain-containing protein n=1 Tax=Eutrema salsugineum TaxID=72664 RepID=V4KZN7_EUTSA|nr:defensin-like protein 295 [Eutrema salsugineum]ESQ32938.1 hypothetical protein EUTSA_v10005651mg [Eutrema salsugineum]